MKIIKYLYIKYSISFFICLIASFSVFFIFSLLGNLNEDLSFNKITYISFLNSFQILSYVPSLLFLLSMILFTIFMKSKNEIVIIKSYLNIRKLLIFFMPIIIFFVFCELYKNNISIFIEDSKADLLKSNSVTSEKVIIKEYEGTKTYIVLNDLDFENLTKTQYREYIISDKKILSAKFSSNLEIEKNNLITNKNTQYKNNIIHENNNISIIDLKLEDLTKNNKIIKYLYKGNKINFNFKIFNLLIFFILFFYFIILSFFNTNSINPKQSLRSPIFLSLIILIYSFFIFNNSLILYKVEFEIIGSVIIGILFFKKYLNE